MAELLIKNCTDDCTILESQHWCQGDIIDVRPDNFQWGTGELSPVFYILKIPNITVENSLKYIDQWLFITGTDNLIISYSKWKHIPESGVLYNKETGEMDSLEI